MNSIDLLRKVRDALLDTTARDVHEVAASGSFLSNVAGQEVLHIHIDDGTGRMFVITVADEDGKG